MFQFSSSYYDRFPTVPSRLYSIDALRGVVMVLMTLDHCRDFFHVYSFDYAPEDLRYTTPIVFYTRWVTHFCAPIFVFLSGISAYLYAQKNNLSKSALAKYLLIRGAILIVLELTIVRFAWRFYIDYSSIGGLILWGIGWSMIALAGIIYLKPKVILALSLFIIFCHNFLDAIDVSAYKGIHLVWAFLHQSEFVALTDNFGVNILYPVLPMIGIIALGYSMGKLFSVEYTPAIRADYLLYMGLSVVSLFFALRFFQLFTEQYSYVFYMQEQDIGKNWTLFFKSIGRFVVEYFGDPSPWVVQENATYSIISFLNTTKYPMSLFYILMTIGPAFIMLSYLETKRNTFTQLLQAIGKVPLFYYLVHLFLLHTLALLIYSIIKPDKYAEILKTDWKSLSAHYGFSMPVIYILTLIAVILLYPLCKKYAALKLSGKYKWMNYF